MLSIVHIARRKGKILFPDVFVKEIEKIGEFTLIQEGRDLSDDERIAILQQADVALTGWNCSAIPAGIVKDPGKLRYVCNVTGEMSGFVPLEVIDSDILVSNWGDSPAVVVAEGAVALLLATLKDIPRQVMTVREGGWTLQGNSGGSLYEADLGLYGCGAIGRRFVDLVKPFSPNISIYDPYATEIPEGCKRVDSLRELFEKNQIISLFAGLSEETRGSVNADLLALLPDNGVIVNTARGGIMDQDALFAELESGRLRAGLDVLEPDALPEGHPARQWQNCIFSAHEITRGWPNDGTRPQKLAPMHKICLENLQAFSEGRPIRFEMTPERFSRST